MYEAGLVHDANALPSRLHVKLAPACVSLKEKLAVVWVVGLGGDDVIVGAGGATVSIVQVKEAGVLVFPSESCASTWKVCEPSASAEYVFGLVQAANAAPSRLQRKPTPARSSLKENVALVWLVGSLGCAVIVGAGGGAVEIVHV